MFRGISSLLKTVLNKVVLTHYKPPLRGGFLISVVTLSLFVATRNLLIASLFGRVVATKQ